MVAIGSLVVVVGCGSSSPENFARTTAKIGCRYTKKCEESDWDKAGYDSVQACADEIADDDHVQAFADACDDFDNAAARKCLAGMRKAKRQCDEDAASSEQEDACAEVCGALDLSPLMSDPDASQAVIRMLEEAVAEAELREDEPVGAEPLVDFAD